MLHIAHCIVVKYMNDSTVMKTATYMIEESYLSYFAASIIVLYIRLLIALIGQNKKRYK